MTLCIVSEKLSGKSVLTIQLYQSSKPKSAFGNSPTLPIGEEASDAVRI